MDMFVLGLYLLGVLAVGIFYGRGVKTLSDFAVAGRSYSALVLTATLSASFIGGGFSMGNAEKVFSLGIVSIVALWGFSLSQLLVARYLAPRMDQYKDALSVGDIMARHYGRAAQIFTGFFATLVCAGILGAQVSAMGYVFKQFAGIDHLWGIIIGVGIVLCYVAVGGMRSVVATDVVQFVLLAVGMPVALILGVIYVGGLGSLLAAVPAERFQIPAPGMGVAAFVSMFLVFLLGETLVPPYVQRLLIASDARTTVKGTWWSGLFSIPFFAITGGIGLVALAIKPDLDPNLSMPFLINEVMPIGVRGVMIAAVISIIMSSADSFLNAATVAFVNDILRPLGRWKLNEKQELSLARYFTVGLGLLAIVFAVSIKSVLDILVFAYNFWAPVILVPLVCAMLGMKVSARQFAVSAISGVVAVICWNQILGQPGGVEGLVIGVMVSLCGFLLVPMRVAPASKPKLI